MLAGGLAPVLATIVERRDGAGSADSTGSPAAPPPPPPAECAGLEPTTLAAAMRSFYSSLFSLSLPEFDRLRNPRLAAQARQQIAVELADAHAAVHRLVMAPESGYSDQSFLLHTPQQVRVLLDCD